MEHRRHSMHSWRLAAAALALGIFSAGLASVAAQDATPMASPPAVACDSPGLPPGTPTPKEEMAMGSPEAGMEMASPEAMEMASPEAAEAEEDVTGTPADEATAATIFAAIENYVACYNEGQASGDPGLYVALESTGFVESQGYTNRYNRAQDDLENPFKTAKLLSIGNAMTWEDGRVSADAQVLVGPYWFNEWRIFLADEDGVWKWDEEADLPPQPDVESVAVNGINLTETPDEATGEITYAFESFSGSWDFTQSEAMIFNFTNSGEEAHEAVLMQLPEGADPMGILDGSIDMSQVSFIGGNFFIPPGGSGNLTVLNLPVGTYTLVCFFPGPDGTPHAAHGMIQQFNVVAAN
jgi:uncharacterized cupredoxin-like copper-binding protein